MKAMDVGQRPESEIQQKNHVERAIIMRTPFTRISGFGVVSVTGRIRVPVPAAMIIARST